jgi:hypothetical protein
LFDTPNTFFSALENCKENLQFIFIKEKSNDSDYKKNYLLRVLLTVFSTAQIFGQDRVASIARFVFSADRSRLRCAAGSARTTHRYRVRARAGQEMAVYLKTGNQTSLTISGRESGILEGADGVRQTGSNCRNRRIRDSDRHDATANYTMEVTIN